LHLLGQLGQASAADLIAGWCGPAAERTVAVSEHSHLTNKVHHDIDRLSGSALFLKEQEQSA
jgi:hypothetical protein